MTGTTVKIINILRFLVECVTDSLLFDYLGYNFIVEIPEGASNIDIRQHAYEGMKDDYNYLGWFWQKNLFYET